MNRLLKAMVSFVLVVLMCLSFSGCTILEDNKERHAVMNSENSTLEYKDTVYKKLPSCSYYRFNDEQDESKILNITDEDVPVLLSAMLYKERGSLKNKGDIIALDYGPYGYYSGKSMLCYCKEELFEGYNDVIKRYGP